MWRYAWGTLRGARRRAAARNLQAGFNASSPLTSQARTMHVRLPPQRFASRLQVHLSEGLGLATAVIIAPSHSTAALPAGPEVLPAAQAGAADPQRQQQRVVPAAGAYFKVYGRAGPGGALWFHKVGGLRFCMLEGAAARPLAGLHNDCCNVGLTP